MARRAVSCVYVASSVRGLAHHVQKLLSSVGVENLQVTDISDDVQSEDRTKQLQEMEVLLCDGTVLMKWLKADAVPNLRWAHQTWAGVDDLMKLFNHQKPKADFTLTRSGEAYGDIMGEYVVGQIIAWERDFAGMKAVQERREFDKRYAAFRPLSALSIGILGYGTIGKRVAEMCKSMGMTVWAMNRVKNTSTCPNVDYFRGMESLGEVLQSVDYLCSILPNTPASTDLLSGQVLKQCQGKKTIFINIGRGNIISDESLVQAVREGWLGGAILDVFNQEPLPPDSDLWTLPNVVITPHVSGPALPQPVASFFVENLKLYLAGQPLHNVVDWDKGY